VAVASIWAAVGDRAGAAVSLRASAVEEPACWPENSRDIAAATCHAQTLWTMSPSSM
jgi:hypothetical protein